MLISQQNHRNAGGNRQPNAFELDYISRRLNPRVGQDMYLHLSDLLLALNLIASDKRMRVLDYGANLSPYRTLFPNSDYRCADIGGPGAKDYLIGDDGKVTEQDKYFDLVISTQVAEHLPHPHAYFAECFRLLKPGGRLFLSTHGAFEDHDFPGDFQRWTAEGMKRDLGKVGFEITAAYKMTAGPRAALHHLERCLDTTFASRMTAAGLLMWLVRALHRGSRPLINQTADWLFSNFKMVPADGPSDDPAHNMYIGIAVVARRLELTR